MKSAYRWAKQHGIKFMFNNKKPSELMYYYPSYKKAGFEFDAAIDTPGNYTISSIYTYTPPSGYTYTPADAYTPPANHMSVVFTANSITINATWHASQSKKEAGVWHEIGHYIDYRQNRIENLLMPILKREARASQKAIKLMKKHGRWSEHKRKWFIDWYKTYSDYSSQKSYIHLIEAA